jgi:hypothetical protein
MGNKLPIPPRLLNKKPPGYLGLGVGGGARAKRGGELARRTEKKDFLQKIFLPKRGDLEAAYHAEEPHLCGRNGLSGPRQWRPAFTQGRSRNRPVSDLGNLCLTLVKGGG